MLNVPVLVPRLWSRLLLPARRREMISASGGGISARINIKIAVSFINEGLIGVSQIGIACQAPFQRPPGEMVKWPDEITNRIERSSEMTVSAGNCSISSSILTVSRGRENMASIMAISSAMTLP